LKAIKLRRKLVVQGGLIAADRTPPSSSERAGHGIFHGLFDGIRKVVAQFVAAKFELWNGAHSMFQGALRGLLSRILVGVLCPSIHSLPGTAIQPRSGNPLTEAAKVTERIRRPNFGSLEIELTVDDPKGYTKTWTVKLRQFLVLDTELLDEICLEGEKSVQHNTVK
jgi:hypothetical protein